MQSYVWIRRTAALALLAVALLYFNFELVQLAKVVCRTHRRQTKPLDAYSFIGSDRPGVLPLPTRPPVKMTVEESVHYALTDLESYAEWLYTAPLGDNDIRLGPEKRVFAVAMFHELHCLRGMREALEGGLASLSKARQGHIHHCFNYLRQWILCDADVTLEPGDFTERDFRTERVGATHTCRDWEPVYEMVNEKWHEWEKFRDAHGLPPFVDTE